MELLQPNYGLANSQQETLTDENPLPRAVLRQNSFVLLDGEWRFAVDREDKGLHDSWHLGHHYEYTASWPGSIEKHMEEAKLQEGTTAWQDKIVAWYEKEFTLPDQLTPETHLMWQLTFGACGYETWVWVNGVLIKSF